MTTNIQSNNFRQIWIRLSKSHFLVGSLMFHLLLVIFFGSKAIFDHPSEKTYAMASDTSGLVTRETNTVSPTLPTLPNSNEIKFNVVQTPMNSVNGIDIIPSTAISPTNHSLPMSMLTTPSYSNTTIIGKTSGPESANSSISTDSKVAIANFICEWALPGSPPSEKLRSRKFKFTAYVAKYNGGDWASTIRRSGDKITAGSLPNLLYLMKIQSHDRIEATLDPEAIDLASDKIFSVKPPFIFFTGHRDFILTSKEVENLQRYVRLGGCIWGDSSLPGQRSRFDLAFRREMKRVIQDADKEFEALPANHDIFTKTYYNEIRSVPPGINGYQDPVYALKYNGEIAVLYTANDYGDMWQIGLDSRWQVDFRKDARGEFVAINPVIWDNRDIIYRGITPQKVADTFKFGTNVVIHLLTRWENKVRSVSAL